MEQKLSKLILLTLVLSISLFIPQTAQAADPVPQNYTQQMLVEAKPIDSRIIILKNYLAKHNSPLENHSKDFIEAADTYQVDWKLVAAIAGVESTFGKNIPGGYNGWGWGVYGDQALYFKSWRDGIFTVTKGLKENYINKGYTTPYAMNKIYAASPTWGSKVSYFMADIEQYAKENPVDQPTVIGKRDIGPESKRPSAQLSQVIKQLALVP